MSLFFLEKGYVPTYTRTDLTNNLHGSAGFRTDTQIVTKQKMRSIIAQTKKRSVAHYYRQIRKS